MTDSIISARTGAGAGLGAFIGMTLGGPPGLLVGLLLGGGFAHKTRRTPGVLTARRQLMFQRAMESVKEPDDLRKLADAFEAENLKDHADLLRKRAGLRELPDDVQAKRRVYFRKGMASDNPVAIRNLALAFAREGAIDAGKKLKEHADAVEAAHAAGKSAKPQNPKVLEAFADKLALAVAHFGTESRQAAAAARNLLNAQGKAATKENVEQLVLYAAKVMKAEQQDVTQVSGEGKVDEGQGTPAVVAADPTGAAEPVVVGPEAPEIEPMTKEQAKAAPVVPVVDASADEIIIEEAAVEEASASDEGQKVRVASR